MEQFATLISRTQSIDKNFYYITFKVNNIFEFKEGQFIMIEDIVNGKLLKRAYSICSTNIELQDNNTISLIVKRIHEYGMSNHLTTYINMGESIKISGPYGHLTNPGINDNYLFIGTGSGVAPLISLYKGIIQNGLKYNKIINLLGFRYISNKLTIIDSIYNQNIENNIYTTIHYSKEELSINDSNNKYSIKNGHVQGSILESLNIINSLNITVFICGQPIMVNECKNILLTYGINKSNIIFEKY